MYAPLNVPLLSRKRWKMPGPHGPARFIRSGHGPGGGPGRRRAAIISMLRRDESGAGWSVRSVKFLSVGEVGSSMKNVDDSRRFNTLHDEPRTDRTDRPGPKTVSQVAPPPLSEAGYPGSWAFDLCHRALSCRAPARTPWTKDHDRNIPSTPTTALLRARPRP